MNEELITKLEYVIEYLRNDDEVKHQRLINMFQIDINRLRGNVE